VYLLFSSVCNLNASSLFLFASSSCRLFSSSFSTELVLLTLFGGWIKESTLVTMFAREAVKVFAF